MEKKRLLGAINIICYILFVAAVCFAEISETSKELVYTNEYFGFSVKIPEGWFVQRQETMDDMLEAAVGFVVGNKADEKVVLVDTLHLLTLTYPSEKPPSNITFTCGAEKVSDLPEIKTAKDHLLAVKKMMAKLEMQAGEISSELVAGREMAVMEVTLNMGSLTAKQKYYATIIKGYAVGPIITYVTEGDLERLEDIIESMEFR